MAKALTVVQPGSPGQTPVFGKIGIVGLGLVGGSLALAAREVWPSALVIGVDDKDVLERAMVQHAIDVAADDLVVVSEADLIVLAAPVEENISLLSRLDDFVPGHAVVTDVGSTKRAIVAAARTLPPRFTFVGRPSARRRGARGHRVRARRSVQGPALDPHPRRRRRGPDRRSALRVRVGSRSRSPDDGARDP